jgi:CrcB protein
MTEGVADGIHGPVHGSVHGPVHGPVDPDVTPDDVASRGHLDVLAVIALGGALGSAARYGVGQLWPTPHGQVPWSTFAVNAVGCFCLGLLMVWVVDVWPPRRYVRPFLGVGVLGGFTTFSTYALDTRQLLALEHPLRAGLYVCATLVAGLAAVVLGALAGRGLTRSSRRVVADVADVAEGAES